MMQVFKIVPIYLFSNLLIGYLRLIKINQNRGALKTNHQVIHHYLTRTNICLIDDQITQIEISTAVEAMVSYHFNL